jgi:AcrR family transcriptional regulator
MIAVADRAKVSRQLVYEHFDSTDALVTETMSHIFSEAYASTRAAIEGGADDIVGLLAQSERMTFDMPPGRLNALRQMIMGAHADHPATARMSRRLRHLLMKMWSPVASDAFGTDERSSRALVWMLHMAFWGVHQLVDEKEIDRATASALLARLVTQLQAPSRRGPGRAR